MSSIPAEKIFTERELEELACRGYRVHCLFPSTGEVLLYSNDRPYGFHISVVRAWANPTWRDRIRNWVGRWAA